VSIPKIDYFMTEGIILLLLFSFPSYIFSFCRSCLVNHIDLEHLFCLEDFLTWDHGQLIWFVVTSYTFFYEMFVVFSLYLVFNLWHFIVVGPVCRNISLCTQTTSNKCNGVTSNSSVYMDKNSLS
jgi:hypothetical protein